MPGKKLGTCNKPSVYSRENGLSTHTMSSVMMSSIKEKEWRDEEWDIGWCFRIRSWGRTLGRSDFWLYTWMRWISVDIVWEPSHSDKSSSNYKDSEAGIHLKRSLEWLTEAISHKVLCHLEEFGFYFEYAVSEWMNEWRELMMCKYGGFKYIDFAVNINWCSIMLHTLIISFIKIQIKPHNLIWI